MRSFLRRHRGRIEAAVGVTLFLAAAFALRHTLQTLTLEGVLHALRSMPPSQVLLAVGMMLVSRGALIGYDWLAFRYLGTDLPLKKIAITSSIAYAFSHNLGFAVLSGATVRYKLYSSFGIPLKDIARVAAFTESTVWLGYLPLGGLVFLLEPLGMSGTPSFPLGSLRWVGGLMMCTGIGYILLTLWRKAPLRIGGLELPLPRPRMAIAQILLSGADWVLTASVLFVLLPIEHRPLFPYFVGLFLAGQLAGMASQVPGGLGVFESILILALGDSVPRAALASVLLVYRLIYYILPLLFALPLFGWQMGQLRRAPQKTASPPDPPPMA